MRCNKKNNKKIYRSLWLVSALAVTHSLLPVAAEEMPDNGIQSNEIDQLDDIVVSDTFTINPNLNPNIATPGNVNQSSANYSDGSDFLKQINGISGSRMGGRGIEPVIRGQSQTQLNVLLDGSRVYASCPNRMDPPASWVALESYETITVLKGVQTLAWGAGGSGGTVLFERDTRALAQDEGLHGRVGAISNSNGTDYDALADVVLASEQAYLRVLADKRDNRNYKDGDGREVRSSFEHLQSGAVAGYMPDDDQLLEFSFDHTEALDVLYPGSGMDSPEEKGKFYKFRYENRFDSPWLRSLKFELFQTDLDHRMDNFSLREFDPGKQMQTLTTSLTNGARLLANARFEKHRIEYGMDWDSNARDATMYKIISGQAKSMSIMWPDIQVSKTGLFVQNNQRLAADKTLKYGLRYDRVRVDYNKADLPSELMMGHTANQSYQKYYGRRGEAKTENNWAFLLRYQQRLNPVLSLFGGLSRTVRTADATERGINKWTPASADRWIGNPDIKPEKHYQLDLGVNLAAQGYHASLSVFYDQVNDYILRDGAQGQDGILESDNADIYRNINARISGLEVQGSQKLSRNYTLAANLAYVYKKNTTDDRYIALTPPLNGRVQLDYQSSPRWALGTRVRFALSQNKVDLSSKQEVGITPAWGVVDIYGHYRIRQMLNLRFGIDNIFNRTYAEHISRSNLMDNYAVRVNEPGLTAWVKLGAEF